VPAVAWHHPAAVWSTTHTPDSVITRSFRKDSKEISEHGIFHGISAFIKFIHMKINRKNI
jgi:hypothetical protein